MFAGMRVIFNMARSQAMNLSAVKRGAMPTICAYKIVPNSFKNQLYRRWAWEIPRPEGHGCSQDKYIREMTYLPSRSQGRSRMS